MENVCFVDKTPFDNSAHLAILIGEPDVGQRHIGIRYRANDAAEFRVLHLAWHCILRNEAKIPHYFQLWIAPAHTKARLRQVAAFCRLVWTKNDASLIPYAFSNPADTLDPATGEFLLGPTRHGLTCASFVLAIFHAAGLPLMAYDTWPTDRLEDRAWQERIIEILEEQHAEARHIQQLRSEVGSARFRPEEVAAAAALAPPPAEFHDASQFGLQIVEKIRKRDQS